MKLPLIRRLQSHRAWVEGIGGPLHPKLQMQQRFRRRKTHLQLRVHSLPGIPQPDTSVSEWSEQFTRDLQQFFCVEVQQWTDPRRDIPSSGHPAQIQWKWVWSGVFGKQIAAIWWVITLFQLGLVYLLRDLTNLDITSKHVLTYFCLTYFTSSSKTKPGRL